MAGGDHSDSQLFWLLDASPEFALHRGQPSQAALHFSRGKERNPKNCPPLGPRKTLYRTGSTLGGKERLKFIELFAGIGGFRLGLERAGHTCVWANEMDPYACRVYRKNWPDGTLYEGDIRTVDSAIIPSHDLLVGGFPCQPVSLAGRRKAQKDERWLWPEIARIFRVSRPRYILLENVPGLLSAGMGDVLRDLADGGYDAEWDCLPAAAVGAPHLRYRVFIVAHAGGMERQARAEKPRIFQDVHEDRAKHDHARRPSPNLADTHNARLERRDSRVLPKCAGEQPPRPRRAPVADALWPEQRRIKRETKTQSHALADSKGKSKRKSTNEKDAFSIFGDARLEFGGGGWWTTEPDVGRVAHGISSRVDRLKCLGNAVVPQVIEWIGRRLKEVEALSLNGEETP